MSNSRRIELILTRFNNWESEAEREEYIDQLEALIEECNEAARRGEEIVSDAIYDTMRDYLRELKPDSYLLHQVWSADDENGVLDEDLDRFLVSYPMLSIQTVKHISDKPVKDFQARLPAGPVQVVASIKLNGHGVRIVWKDGHLVKATSRGRSTVGRDLTPQMRLILGDFCPALKDLGLVEVRCEVVLPFSNLAKAREFNPSIKSAFTAVSSMIRASASPEETRLLNVVMYDILCDQLQFTTLSEKFSYLEDCGFQVPAYAIHTVSRRTLEQDIENILMQMDYDTTDYEYYTDGVVLTIDDLDLFAEFGQEDSFRYGNLALKMGRWKQDSYVGIVGRIEWMEGKSKKTPVAVLAEPVLTATGNHVTNVPLYAPLYILILEAYPGNPIHFRYGGEAGVVPVTPDGRLITDPSVTSSVDLSQYM